MSLAALKLGHTNIEYIPQRVASGVFGGMWPRVRDGFFVFYDEVEDFFGDSCVGMLFLSQCL